MLYSIITPTYKRPDLLVRCVKSVISQVSRDSEFRIEILIINDSPSYDYSAFENSDFISNPIIKYFKNDNNRGNNYSKNYALDKISPESDYVIYLDDDDWLAEGALRDIDKTIKGLASPSSSDSVVWLVTNRVLNDSKILTQNNTGKSRIDYFIDYLALKSFNGDATHIIKSNIAKGARFARTLPNGEEIYYFLQLPKYFIYKNLNSTITSGYSDIGLTADLASKYRSNTTLLWWDLFNTKNKNFIVTIKILTYLIYRSIVSLVK